MPNRILNLFRDLVRRPKVEQAFDAQNRSSVELLAEKKGKQGFPQLVARREAPVQLGGVEYVKEEVRTARFERFLEDFARDVRFAFRTLAKSSGFTTVAVLTLALGIGANTAIFSVMYALLLRPLPVPNPEQLVEVTPSYRSDVNLHTYAVWKQIQAQQRSLAGLFAYSFNEPTFHLTSAGEARRLTGLYVSGDYFVTLGVLPALGRILIPSDDQRGAPRVCVISYGFWRQQFDEARNAIGSKLMLDGRPFEVVGVAPQRFSGVKLDVAVDVFVPLAAEPDFDTRRPMYDDPHSWWLSIGGRLKQGISVAEASTRLRAMGPSIYRMALPSDDTRIEKVPNMTLVARSISRGICYLRYQYSEILWLLLMMVGVALLIACLNLANLLLVRSMARQHEIATRLALGAGRGRLLRQLLVESTLLTLAGAVAGLVLARWASAVLVAAVSFPYEPFGLDLTWDPKLLAFCAGTTALCALVIGVGPALRATDVSLHSVIKSGATGLAGRGRFSGVPLIVTQVALSMALLVGAGLLVRTVQDLLAVDLGYEPKGLLWVMADIGEGQNSPLRQELLAEQLVTEFRSVPGVISAARSGSAPWQAKPNVLVRTSDGSDRRYHCFILLVSPEFFTIRRSRLLAGRSLTQDDGKTAPAVAILSETAARALFPGVSPVGLMYHQMNGDGDVRGEMVRVVGVVKDIQYQRPDRAPLLVVFRPISQGTPSRYTLANYELRFAGPLSRVTRLLRVAARRVDGSLSLNLQMAPDAINGLIHRERMTAMISTFFGLLSLALTAIGIYGVTAFTVAQRTKEIGIRMALGAQRGDVWQMVIRGSLTAAVAGIALGGTAGFLLAHAIREMLYGVGPGDRFSFAVAACSMLFVASAAALIPALRASKLDPLVALRHQ